MATSLASIRCTYATGRSARRTRYQDAYTFTSVDCTASCALWWLPVSRNAVRYKDGVPFLHEPHVPLLLTRPHTAS